MEAGINSWEIDASSPSWSASFGCGYSPCKHQLLFIEAVADYDDLWKRYAYFGMSISNNDVNALKSSNLLNSLMKGNGSPALYVIDGREYNMVYYLVDSILSEMVQCYANNS